VTSGQNGGALGILLGLRHGVQQWRKAMRVSIERRTMRGGNARVVEKLVRSIDDVLRSAM
jgi:hypothetical protein